MRSRTWLGLVAGLCVVLAACSSPTAAETDGGGGSGGVEGDRHDEIIALMDEIAALPTFEEREERLLELAREEGSQLNYYASGNPDQTQPLIELFEETYEIDVNHYRAQADTIALRVLEEFRAGYPGADLVVGAGRDTRVLSEEGVYVTPLHEFLSDGLVPAAVGSYGINYTYNVYTVVWNTDRVDNPPSTLQEAMEWDGDVAVDPRDFDWFYGVINEYLMGQQGMTEEEALAYFEEQAQNWFAVQGHSLGMEMLVGGEFDLHLSQYLHQVDRFEEDVPVGWEPAIEPLWIRGGGGTGISRTAQHPAASLLWMMWHGTDEVQRSRAEAGRTISSANEDIELGRVPTEYEQVTVNNEEIDSDHWADLYTDVMQNATRAGE